MSALHPDQGDDCSRVWEKRLHAAMDAPPSSEL